MRNNIWMQGHNAHSWEMRVILGLEENSKLPLEGMPPRRVHGIVVWVAPIPAKQSRFRRMAHRVRLQCPNCDQVMSAGRFHQHVCKAER